MVTRGVRIPRALFWTFSGFVAFFVAYFSPVAFTKLMASGDALVESLPAYLGPHNLWDPTILLGYPLFADPNQQFWYPLAWVHLLPDTYNAFAIAPFVLAATGMAGFVRALTRSTPAGIVAGLVYSLGGFMISHAGHLMLSHPAAWAPFVLWGIESMRRRTDGVPIIAIALALGLCGLSGQPQIFVFAATLGALYALVSASHAALAPRRFLLRTATAFVLGVGFAATQLMPEALLARESTRASLTFDAFTQFEVPLDQLALRAIFPYVLGATNSAWYPFSRYDLGTFTEDTIAVGLVSLAVALLAMTLLGEDRRIAFWYAVACGALVLAVGDATPVASITYRLPVYDLFRAPGRHAFEFTFAIAVLAGYGCSAIVRARARARHILFAGASLAVISAATYVQVFAGHSTVLAQIVATYAADAARVASPFVNGAIGVPLATGAIGCVLLWVATRARSVRVAGALVVCAVGIDVGTFGSFAYWNWAAASDRDLKAAAWVSALGARARATDTRIAWLPGVLGAGMPPNLTSLWNVPIVGGYTPLVPRRTQALLGITVAGGTPVPNVGDAGLDLAGSSVVATTPEQNVPLTAAQPFANGDLQTFIGPSGRVVGSRAAFGLPAPFAATRVAMVSELGDSPSIPDNAKVAELDVVDVAGHREQHSILAGRDTAEFAYDRADVRPIVRHRRAQIFSGDAATHDYVAYFKIATHAPVDRVEIRWTYANPSTGALTIEKLSLVDDSRRVAAAYGKLAALYAARDHWTPMPVDASIVAFENRRPMPRAWFAFPIVSENAAAIGAIRGGFFPDGSRFDMRRDVTIESMPVYVGPPEDNDRITIDEDRPGRQVLTTVCAKPCFLVIRDAYDPQWRVSIDGRAGAVVPADIALRGVAVPAGTHRVRFAFVPMSLYVGTLLTAGAAFASIVLLFASASIRIRRSSRRPTLQQDVQRRPQCKV